MSLAGLSDPVCVAPGVHMPRVGLGVFRAGSGDGTIDAVLHALRSGYRHVDTAAIYGNEEEVGEAIRRSGLPRAEVFVTTKLWNEDQGYDAAMRAFDRSLRALATDWVDLYLIHWPVPDRRRESWRALQAIRESGRARAIGVSNYTERHLHELMESSDVLPAVNQFEAHPFLPQVGLRRFCAAHGIAVQAYCPLVRGRRLAEPALVEVAAQVGKTPAQVLLRWGLQRDMVILPKSSDPGRIDENFGLFDFCLDAAQLARLDALDDSYRVAWDPSAVP